MPAACCWKLFEYRFATLTLELLRELLELRSEDDRRELLDTIEEASDEDTLLDDEERLDELATELVGLLDATPSQAPKSVQALVHAQPIPGS